MAASKVPENGGLHVPGENRKLQLNSDIRRTSLGSRLNLYFGSRKSITAMEERLLFAAEMGDLETVRSIIEYPQFNADFSDALGRTPLRLAVAKEHVEIVGLLLKHSNNTSIREALLQAISNGNEQIAEFILKYLDNKDDAKEKQKFGKDDYFFSQCQEGSQFSADTTPLMLAAWKNRFQIVLLLLRSGERIDKPHHCYCNCLDCRNKRQFDELRLAKSRLNAYRGLASEAYISLSSKDPILEAFQLGQELRAIADIDKCYKTEYLALSDELSEYVVKLLDKIRGHDELEVILNKVGDDLEEEDETSELLERFKLAIEYNEKKFVAHPSCQQKLIGIWYSNFRIFERANLFIKFLIGLAIMVSYTFLAICFWIAPHSKIGTLLRSPCVKFLGRLMSLLVFMVMILVSSLTKHETRRVTSWDRINVASSGYLHDTCAEKNLCPFVVRQSWPTEIEVLLMLWVLGTLWQEIKQVYQNGIVGYFDALFNYLDTAVLILYLTCFSLKITCMCKVNNSLDYFGEAESWESLRKGDEEAERQLYWLIADRFYWHSNDPENLAESAFATANIISFTRICYIFPAHELIGPLQISLARMAKDILTFIVIFLVLFMAFMVGLHNLYWYYPSSTRSRFELFDHNITTEAEQYFGKLPLTFRTVFWASIGQGENRAVRLDNYNKEFTQDVGYWIFGAYNVANAIVLLNLLIAMMTRSFDSIQSEAHAEWKFARSILYMEYIKEDCTLPVPFNIVPSPKFFWKTFRSVYGYLKARNEPEQVYYPGRIPDLELFGSHSNASTCSTNSPTTPTPNPQIDNPMFNAGIRCFQTQMSRNLARTETNPNFFSDKLTYKRVMNRIIRRYMFDKHVAECAEDESKCQDSCNFRFELQSVLAESQKEITTMIYDQGCKLAELAKVVQSLKGGKAETLSSPQDTRKTVKLNSEHARLAYIDDN